MAVKEWAVVFNFVSSIPEFHVGLRIVLRISWQFPGKMFMSNPQIRHCLGFDGSCKCYNLRLTASHNDVHGIGKSA